jgi:hypothetical protein
MNKKLIFLIAALVLGGFFLLKMSSENQKKNQVPQINTKAIYDEPKMKVDAGDTAKLEKFKAAESDKVGAPDQTEFLQTYKSGALMTVTVPSDPVASTSALKQNAKVSGWQIASPDYYITFFHLLKLDSSQELCNSLKQTNAHQGLYIKSRVPVKTAATTSTEWELTDTQGLTVKQFNGCYVDGNDKAWIVDVYMNIKKFEMGYREKVLAMLNSFIFTQ